MQNNSSSSSPRAKNGARLRLRTQARSWVAYASSLFLCAGFFYMTQPDWRLRTSSQRNLLSGQVVAGKAGLARVPVHILMDIDQNAKPGTQDLLLGSTHTDAEGNFSLMLDQARKLQQEAQLETLPEATDMDMGASLCFKSLNIPPYASLSRAYIRFSALEDARSGGETMISSVESESDAPARRRGSLLWHIPEIVRGRVYDSPDLSRLLRQSDQSPEFWVEGLTGLPFFADEQEYRPTLVVEYVLPQLPYIVVVAHAAVEPAWEGNSVQIPFGSAKDLLLVCPPRKPGKISGQVFHDLNGDGVPQELENGWQEAELALYHQEDGFQEPVARFRTGASGRFAWEADRSGTFLLRLRSLQADSLAMATTPRETCFDIGADIFSTTIPAVRFGMRSL